MSLPRTAWVKFNRLETRVGKFHSPMSKWGLASSPHCEYGAIAQTAYHVLTTLTIHCAPWAPQGTSELPVWDDETRC